MRRRVEKNRGTLGWIFCVRTLAFCVSLLCLVSISRVCLGQEPNPPSEEIPAREAHKHLNERCVVKMAVVRTDVSKSRGILFLSSGTNLNDPETLNIYIPPRLVSDLRGHAQIPPRVATRDFFVGKLVRVTGTITQFDRRTELKLNSLSALEVLGEAPPPEPVPQPVRRTNWTRIVLWVAGISLVLLGLGLILYIRTRSSTEGES